MEPTQTPGPPARLARRAALLAAIASCVALDQVTKALASASLAPGARHSFLADTVRLELAHNSGAFLSLGASLPAGIRAHLFTWFVGLLVLGALWFAFRARTPTRAAAGAALVAAGGLGNLWDRIATGGWVVDFMNLGLGPLRTGIFNVADVALMAGVALIAWPERRGAEPAA
jgi:signal peptidase II